MDLLTQGLLGTAMAQAGAKQQEIRIATGIGFFSRHYSGCGYPDPIGKRSAAQYRISPAFHAFAVFRATWRFDRRVAAVAIFAQTFACFAGVIAFRKYSHTAARIGLLLAAVYLSCGWIQLQRTETGLRH